MTKTESPRYRVQRTLSYAHTFYGATDDLAEAKALAERQSLLGYPSEVVDTKYGLHFGWHRPEAVR